MGGSRVKSYAKSRIGSHDHRFYNHGVTDSKMPFLLTCQVCSKILLLLLLALTLPITKSPMSVNQETKLIHQLILLISIFLDLVV